MRAPQACATEATDLLGDGSTCIHAQIDEVMSATPCARSASEANSTHRLDHKEGVVAMASAAPRTIQATQ